MEKSTIHQQNTIHNSIYYLHNGFMPIKNYKSENRFTNFKIHYMKTLLKISLAFIIFVSYNNLFASGWQQKLDLINPSDRAANSEIILHNLGTRLSIYINTKKKMAKFYCLISVM